MARKPEFKVPEDLNEEYANAVRVTHGPHDFLIDFCRHNIDEGRLDVISRIRVSPTQAKSIVGVLAENVKKYEEKFGEIMEIGRKRKEEGEKEEFYIG